jgi:hypothetical protein
LPAPRLKTALLLGVLLLTFAPARAQSGGLSFLRIGIDAAGGALGDAHAALSRDLYATYWNPAGLAAATENQAGVVHHLWVGDVRTYAAAGRFGVGTRGGFGLLVRATGAGDMEARERPGEPDGFFDAQFLSLGAAYGHTLGAGLRVGAGAKFLSERIYFERATGFAFDAGVQGEYFRQGLQVGATVQNIGTMSDLGGEPTPLPTLARVGVALHPFRILADDGAPLFEAMVTAEASHVFTGSETRYHFGVGTAAMDLITLRAGLITGDQLRRFTVGAGVHQGPFRLDYAFVPFRGDFGDPGHLLSLVYGW